MVFRQTNADKPPIIGTKMPTALQKNRAAAAIELQYTRTTRSPPIAPTGPQTSAKCGLSTPDRQIHTGTPLPGKFPSKNPRKTQNGGSGASEESENRGAHINWLRYWAFDGSCSRFAAGMYAERTPGEPSLHIVARTVMTCDGSGLGAELAVLVAPREDKPRASQTA
jgi:hypothetical protein